VVVGRLCIALAVLVLACDGDDGQREVKVGEAPPAERDRERERAEDDMAKQSDSKPVGAIPIEEVAKHPYPGTAIPGALRWTPDGTRITYLYSTGGTLTRELFVEDPAAPGRKPLFAPPEGGATEDNLSEEEKLRRERERNRNLGVTRYEWAEKADRFLVPLLGDVWVQDGLEGPPRKVVDTDAAPALDVHFSRDGEWIAYVLDAEVHVVASRGGTPKQVTSGARGNGITHGLAEYIAQEEMGRHRGYWWSHDGTQIAYERVDERHIPIYRIEHQGKDAPFHEDHGYPFAGEKNAKVGLGVVGRSGGKTVWMDLNATGIAGGGDPDDIYLARVHWMPDGSLLAEVENREQSRLHLVRFDTRTGAGTLVLEEKSDVWINLHDDFHAIEEGELAGGFVWASERTGFKHLYAYDKDGKEVRALTQGEWVVDGLVEVDEKEGVVFFTGSKNGPTEKHLYRVNLLGPSGPKGLAGGDIAALTTEPGMHAIVMSPTFDRFIDTWSDLSGPSRIAIRNASDGSAVGEVAFDPDPRVERLGLRAPELVTLQSRDGVELHGAIYKPEGVKGPFPVIVSVYGGPHAQRVQNDWSLTVDMRAQYLAGLGYLVFKLDNRGSARRGLAFEGALRHDMGNIELQDQVDGVKWLVDEGLADPARVGIMGWSYGGYMAAMALARAPETFAVAVAGAPVSHWDGYDTHYTERYMGTPQSNAEGYTRSSVMAHLDGMKGHLLVVHGLIDENVHFRHSARLINALVKAGKPYELLLFPDERHMPRREADLVYMESRITDFFERRL
jgi:dipeptidyl-peptidase-4